MNTPITMLPCQSSNIAAVGYDPITKILAVQFKSGGTYHYADVPAEVWAKFVTAPSLGSFFQTEIRGAFSSKKLEEEANGERQ